MNRYLDIKSIQQRQLDILLRLNEICKKNNFIYYLSGGTLLGAVRHHGFIPWDDDIDICMPRNDYTKLLDTIDSSDFRFIFKANHIGNLQMPFAKFYDTKTHVNFKFQDTENENNLWLDIFPVDGLPNDINKVREIYKKCDFYRTMLLLNKARLGEGKTCIRKYAKYILKPVAQIYGEDRLVRTIENIAKSYPYEQSSYVGAITWGLYGVGERMLKSEFEKSVEVEFEGHKFPAFSCWDSYLHGLYGDYMQLPPVDKRKNHDMQVWIDN